VVGLLRKKPAAVESVPSPVAATPSSGQPSGLIKNSTDRLRLNFPAMGQPVIVCDNLVKIYKVAELEVVALQGLDLTVSRGEVMAIIGNSGSGKSTLLNILGLLDRPSAGPVTVGNLDLLKMDD